MTSCLQKNYEQNKQEIDQPNWEDVYSWEIKVPEELEPSWEPLSEVLRTVVFAVANYAYLAEPWTE